MGYTARVFNIMEYFEHPITGETLITMEQVEKALAHKTFKAWAWIIHNEDTYSEADEQDERVPKDKHAGDKKPPHIHIVARTASNIDVSMVARWFGIPENFVDCPKGHGAFLDCVEYLTHESEKQQALGKHLYADDEVHTSEGFDFRSELLARSARRAKYGGKDLSPRDRQRHDVMVSGKTLLQCYKDDPMLYAQDLDKLKKLRGEYLANREPPTLRQNFYICGRGGIGKGLASMALARSLYPELSDDECFFTVGGSNVSFDGYDGQPVIIWEDCRASDLLRKVGGRGDVFTVLDPIPKKSKQNIKFGSIQLINEVNIVNSVQPYQEFLDELVSGLASAEYEDKGQSYRRFPFIMPLEESYFDFLVSRGYLDNSNDWAEFVRYRHTRGSFANLYRRLGGTDTARDIERNLLAEPVAKAKELRQARESIDATSVDMSEFEHYGESSAPMDIINLGYTGDIEPDGDATPIDLDGLVDIQG